VRTALRQPLDLRPPARGGRRALAGRTGGGVDHHPAVPAAVPGPGDDLHHGDRHPRADRPARHGRGQRRTPAGPRRPAPAGSPRGLRKRPGRRPGGVPPAPGVRPADSAVSGGRGRSDGPRWRRVAGADHAHAARSDRRRRDGDLDPDGRRDRAPGTAPLDTGADAGPHLDAAGAVRRGRPHGPGLAVLVEAASGVRGTVGGPGAPQWPSPAGPVLPAQWRHRGRRDDVAARGGRWRTQLGLPVLLGARRQPDHGSAVGGCLPRRGRRLLRLHDHRGGGQRRLRPGAGPGAADHVRRGR
jgi:hypothetical protein